MEFGLAERLRSETREIHFEVERTGIMRPMLRGQLSLNDYRTMLRNLYDIYRALEAALERHAALPGVGPICFPQLFRSNAIGNDMDLLAEVGWRDKIAVVSATRRYVARIRELEAGRPEYLVAHAYVRYLGDLSGGQLLKKVVAPVVAPRAAQALHFYEFGSFDEVRGLVQAFRLGLNAISDGAQGDQAIVDEAVRAFELHRALFEEIAPAA